MSLVETATASASGSIIAFVLIKLWRTITRRVKVKGLLVDRKIEIVRIYDGDTVFVNINLGMNITMNNISIRLYGINTPEVKGVEREEGLKSKDALIEYIKDHSLYSL